jgi:drug/metabolite transporter (DMT)-like permease
VLAAGVLAVSTAAILIRFVQAEGMGAIAISAYRLGLAAVFLAPFVARAALAAFFGLPGSDRLKILGAGVCLAVHFGAWISSLGLTSVASSVALVTSHPLWVAIATYLVFRERPGYLGCAGILCTMLGAATIFMADQTAGLGANPLLGNALAVLGAISVAAYILFARVLRKAAATWSYVWLVYTVSALLLAGTALLTGELAILPSGAGLGYLIALALGPQLIGHTAINWSARYLAPTMVSVAILGEPIFSALLAWLLLGEAVTLLQYLGFALTATGIVLCAFDRGLTGRNEA